MKVLILTGSTGGGHNSAAKALAKICDEFNIESQIYDITAMKEGVTNIPSTCYEQVIKYIPHVYKLVYKMSNNKSVVLLNYLIRKSTKALYNQIMKYNPDVIVSVHPVSVSMLKRIRRKKYKMNIPYIQIVPDFHAHEVYIDKDIKAYITPSEYTNLSLASRKEVLLNNTYNYGNPIEDRFISNEEGHNELKNAVMILLGSMGYEGNIKKVYDLLDRDNERKYYFITGKNKELKEKLEKVYKYKIEQNKLEVLGFIDDIDNVMKKVDLVLTKVGGGSLAECINLRKPMILINPIPGQEQENVRIMNMYNIGKDGTENLLFDMIDEIYKNPKLFYSMVDSIDRLTINYSKENIINLIKKVYSENKEME